MAELSSSQGDLSISNVEITDILQHPLPPSEACRLLLAYRGAMQAAAELNWIRYA